MKWWHYHVNPSNSNNNSAKSKVPEVAADVDAVVEALEIEAMDTGKAEIIVVRIYECNLLTYNYTYSLITYNLI